MAEQEEAEMRRRILELEAEVEHLTTVLQEGGVPKAVSWLQWKVLRQRVALDALNRRVLSQRFVLRLLNEAGRGMTAEEYRVARDRAGNPRLEEALA